MHEPRGRQRLAAEARDELGVVGQVLGQQLDGDVALEALVEGEQDGRHAADAEPALELVAAGDAVVGHGAGAPAAALALAVVGAAVVAVPGRVPLPLPPVVSVPPVSVFGLGVLGLGRRRGRGARGRLRGRRARRSTPSSRCFGGRRGLASAGRRRTRTPPWRAGGRGPARGAALSSGSTLLGSCWTWVWALDGGVGAAAAAVAGRRRGGVDVLVDRVGVAAAGSGAPSAAAGDEERGVGRGRRKQDPERGDGSGCRGAAGSLTVLQALGQRVGQARGADRGRGAGDVVRRSAASAPPSASVSSSSQAARGSPSRGWPTLPGLSIHSPARDVQLVAGARGSRPVAGSPLARTKDSATWRVADQAHAVALGVEAQLGQQGGRARTPTPGRAGDAW